MSPPQLKVAVIGAGVAGLATARALKLEQHQVVIYEKSGQLGGTWVYDPRTESDPLGLDPNREIIHGSMYPSLRANLPRPLMGFSDYPFSSKIRNGEFRTFPSHEEVLQFLIGFAEEFGLVDLIRFESEVVRVERVGLRNDNWVVGSRTQGRSSEEIFDAVVVCNGHNTQPRLAHLPVQMIDNRMMEPDWFCNQKICDVRSILDDWPKWKMKKIHRTCNFAAHNLCKWGLLMNWSEPVPFDCLPKDVFCDLDSPQEPLCNPFAYLII